MRAVDLAGQLRRLGQDRLDLVDLVQVVDTLQDRRDPLQAHARVDVPLGQITDDRELFLALHVGDLVLHEDQVPVLHVPVLVDLRAAVLAVLGAAVVEELGAGATRAGDAHVPPVVLLAPAHDPLGGHADGAPHLERLVVVEVDGRPDALRVQPEATLLDRVGRQLPGEADGLFLEVVTEREVAVHLEESAVPRGLTDLVDVRRPDALLYAHRARIRRCALPQEERHELHHAGVDEQQVRVVDGRQRGTRHDRVPVGLEMRQIAPLDLRRLHR